MDATLPLTPLESRLPVDRPFTRAMARAAGVDRPALDRLLRDGVITRLLRGVYAGATAPDAPEVRAAAVALVAGRRAVAVDRTAAWVHGVDVTRLRPGEARPLDLLVPGRGNGHTFGGGRQLTGRDVECHDGLRITTPLRTALDLGRLLPPGLALAALDGLLVTGGFRHVDLLAELPRMAGHRGVGQLRTLAVQADGRARGLAESALRLVWHEARLPSAVPGLTVAVGTRRVRLSLGVERCQFGAVLAEQVTPEELASVRHTGWQVLVLGAGRVLEGDPEVLTRHLECEFHQHLLAQIS
jgi:hypothetical protein